jgi:hypothetical protein
VQEHRQAGLPRKLELASEEAPLRLSIAEVQPVRGGVGAGWGWGWGGIMLAGSRGSGAVVGVCGGVPCCGMLP